MAILAVSLSGTMPSGTLETVPTIARDAMAFLGQSEGASPADEELLVSCVERVVSEQLGDLIVTPREVDALVERMAGILAEGINMALHPALTAQEIAQLTAQ